MLGQIGIVVARNSFGFLCEHVSVCPLLNLLQIGDCAMMVVEVEDVVDITPQKLPPRGVRGVHRLTDINYKHNAVAHATRQSPPIPLQKVVLAEVSVDQIALLEHVTQEMHALEDGATVHGTVTGNHLAQGGSRHVAIPDHPHQQDVLLEENGLRTGDLRLVELQQVEVFLPRPRVHDRRVASRDALQRDKAMVALQSIRPSSPTKM